MKPEELKQELDGIKTSLDSNVNKVKESLEQSINKVKELAEKGITNEGVKAAIAEEVKTINTTLQAINEWKNERGVADLENQKALDAVIAQLKDINKNTKKSEGKYFDEAYAEAVSKEENWRQIQKVSKGMPFKMQLEGKVIMDMKTVGPGLLSSNLTGDSVVSYGSKQALLPAQKVNFRDLMRTVNSPTGTYVHYKETAGEGSIGNQTEGSAKAQIDFDLTEVKTVNKYVAGFHRFSKQLQRSLPFYTQTLPTLLMREFFRQENSTFKGSVAAAATGTWNTTAETDKVKRLIDFISLQRDANYNVDFALVNHTAMAEYAKGTYGAGYYAGAGTVMVNPQFPGTLTILGVPVIPVSWMSASKVLLIDSDYLERVEVEGLSVQFFEQDSDNVQKNLITARIECYEEVNPMLGAAFTFANL